MKGEVKSRTKREKGSRNYDIISKRNSNPVRTLISLLTFRIGVLMMFISILLIISFATQTAYLTHLIAALLFALIAGFLVFLMERFHVDIRIAGCGVLLFISLSDFLIIWPFIRRFMPPLEAYIFVLGVVALTNSISAKNLFKAYREADIKTDSYKRDPQKKFKVSKFSLVFIMICVLFVASLRLVSPISYPPYSAAGLLFIFFVWLFMFLAERSRVNRRMAVYSALIFLFLGFFLSMYDLFLYNIHRSRSPLESLMALIIIAPASLIIIKNLLEIYRGG